MIMVTVKSLVNKTFDIDSIFKKDGSTWVTLGATSSTNTYDIWITKASTF
jgi:hypothetical protein